MPDAIDDADAAAVLDRFDGLLLLGGGDLDPEQLRPRPARRDLRRRSRTATRSSSRSPAPPSIAASRCWRSAAAHQVLNVALGGTLDQHITDRDGVLRPRQARRRGRSTSHDVEIEPGSRLAPRWASSHASCSSHHHQAVDRTGDGLRVTRPRSRRRSIEGIELDGDAWIVGAQWHPEDTAADDPAQQRLFDTFARQAGAITP